MAYGAIKHRLYREKIDKTLESGQAQDKEKGRERANSMSVLEMWANKEVSRLTTSRLDITNHSDRCLEAFHCSSAVNSSCPI